MNSPEKASKRSSQPSDGSGIRGTSAPLFHGQGVAHRVAEEVEAEHDDHDHGAREHGVPPGIEDVLLTAIDHGAPTGERLLDAEAQEGERRLREDGPGHAKGADDD